MAGVVGNLKDRAFVERAKNYLILNGVGHHYDRLAISVDVCNKSVSAQILRFRGPNAPIPDPNVSSGAYLISFQVSNISFIDINNSDIVLNIWEKLPIFHLFM